MKQYRIFLLILLACLTLGLAPYSPEPHIWEKIKWIGNGAHGMEAIHWFDTFLHGLPWVLLIAYTLQIISNKWGKRPA